MIIDSSIILIIMAYLSYFAFTLKGVATRSNILTDESGFHFDNYFCANRNHLLTTIIIVFSYVAILPSLLNLLFGLMDINVT